MKNKPLALLLAAGLLLLGSVSGTAQSNGNNGVKDYASTPYWME
jgi:hypothetical protein